MIDMMGRLSVGLLCMLALNSVDVLGEKYYVPQEAQFEQGPTDYQNTNSRSTSSRLVVATQLPAPYQAIVQELHPQQQQQQPPPPPPQVQQSQQKLEQPVAPIQVVQQPAPQPAPPQKQPPIQYQQIPPPTAEHYHSNSPLYTGHNPYIEILRPYSYADDNIVTLNLSHSHIYEIDSDAFVGQLFEHIDLSNNKLGLIHSKSFRIGPQHSRHFDQKANGSSKTGPVGGRRPPPVNPKKFTIDLSNNPAIVALSGAFDHIDVPQCLLNFTNSTIELKFGAFKKYLKEHPGHMIDIATVDCCEQEWLLGYKHNFLPKAHCEHDPSLFLSRASQQAIIDSCIAYVKSGRRSMTIQGPSLIHQVGASQKNPSPMSDCHDLTYLILGGTAMILTSLSIYIIFYMFSLKAAFVYQMQCKS